MPNSPTPASHSVLLTFRFVGPALLGSLAMSLVCALAPLEAQVAVLGGLVSILGGLFLSYVAQEQDDLIRFVSTGVNSTTSPRGRHV